MTDPASRPEDSKSGSGVRPLDKADPVSPSGGCETPLDPPLGGALKPEAEIAARPSGGSPVGHSATVAPGIETDADMLARLAQPANERRLLWLDAFRGAAVLFMIETHVVNTFLASQLR